MQSDQSRYKKLLQDLSNAFTTGTDNYPKTLTAAYNLKVNYEFDAKPPSQPPPQVTTCNQSTTSSITSPLTVTGNDNDDSAGGMAFVQQSGTANNTTQLTEAQTKAVNMLLQGASGESTEVDQQHDGLSFGLSMHIMGTPTSYMDLTPTQKIILKNGGMVDKHWILLDNQSTINIFKNKDF
jgi:hypothetical protein